MTAFVDTDVLVDCLRGTRAAYDWLNANSAQEFCVPGIVAMELVVGCRNQADLNRVHRLLSTFEVVWPDQTEFAAAFDLLSHYRLRDGLSIPDCIIAAMAIQHNAVLYTFNVKHFASVEGCELAQPYERA